MHDNGFLVLSKGVQIGKIDKIDFTTTVDDDSEIPASIGFLQPEALTFTGFYEGNINYIIYDKKERKTWNLLQRSKSKRQIKKRYKKYTVVGGGIVY